VPTARARDFRPILVALLAWGNKHFAPEGASVLLVNTRTGVAVDPILVDRATGQPIKEPEYAFAPGPAAGARTRRRYANGATALRKHDDNRNRGKRSARGSSSAL
jgi:hypothetical protein